METTQQETPENITDDYEPFLMRERTPEELADYDAGFTGRPRGKEWDDAQSFACQCG